MLFHVVPENVFGDRAGYSRPCFYRRHPCRRQQQLSNIGFLHDILRPLTVMSHNNPESECCHGRRPCDTESGGAQRGECPAQKQVPKSMIACLDFRGFSAGEIKVKVTDSAVVVCGRHDDPGNSFRVTRTLPLPPGFDRTGIICRYVDGKVTLEIPASTKVTVEEKPEKQEDEKKIEQKEENIKTGPTRTSDTGDDDDDDDDGLEIDREVQAAFQVGMEHLTGLFSSIFGLPLEEKKDLLNRSPDQKEEPAEQTNPGLDSDEPRPEDNTTETESLDDLTDVEEERSEEEKGEEDDTCLMLKYDEKLSLTDDADDFLTSDREEDVEKTQVEAEEKVPISSTSQDFKIRFDLSSYKPDDIRVVVRSGDVIVEAERENKHDEYTETETLRRRISLPDKVDQSMLTSVLNAEGEMTIQAPFLSQAISGKEEKTVPVIWE